MRRAAALLMLAALLALGGLRLASPATADTVIDSATVENGYPKQLTFKLTAHADSEITDVTLNYAITGRNTAALGKPGDLEPGTSVSTQVVLAVNSASSYIPVGSEFVYHWEITTADGQKFTGPDTKYFFLPPGQQWQSVSGDWMTVYYHGDKQSLANAYLKAGVDTYEKMGALLQTQLEQTPVKVILFDDEQESAKARPPTSASFDASVTTCGTKVTDDIVLVIPVSCGTPDRTDTLRHEFTHILNETAGEGALGKLPSWLDEGTAVNGQATPGDNYTGAFQSAVRADRLIPFDQMGTAPTDANKVNLFYGQSYEMAKFLIEKSPDDFAKLFATIKKGSRFDDAIEQVYGFDMDGFEDEFRAANGLAPAEAPAATPTPRPQSQQQQPTAASAPTRAVSTTVSSDNGIGTGIVIIVGIAVLFGLLAVLAFLFSLYLQNNRKPPSTPPPSSP